MLVTPSNISFLKENYQDQINALNNFMQESNVKSIPKGKIKFGGGTALAIYYFQHRLSFDIDMFVSDIQYLDYARPKLWIEESKEFNPLKYKDLYNHIGLVSRNGIKVDILADTNHSDGFVDKSNLLFSSDVYIEDVKDIIAKKITFRKKDNKARDILDISIALSKNETLLEELIKLEKICLEDLVDLEEALKNIVMIKYNIEIEIVEPFDEYLELSKNAPGIILKYISKVLNSQ